VYGLNTITPPDEEPVSLDDAKLHLRVSHDEEDGIISSWIKAARELSETHTGRRWVEQELRATWANWPCPSDGLNSAIRLPVEPVQSVESVKYYATDGTLTTLATSEWQTWLDHSPPLVAPAPAKVWPTVQANRLGAVRVEFTAGYADVDAVPEQVRAAILLCLGHWYENRGDAEERVAIPFSYGMPVAAKRLLDSLSTGAYA